MGNQCFACLHSHICGEWLLWCNRWDLCITVDTNQLSRLHKEEQLAAIQNISSVRVLLAEPRLRKLLEAVSAGELRRGPVEVGFSLSENVVLCFLVLYHWIKILDSVYNQL